FKRSARHDHEPAPSRAPPRWVRWVRKTRPNPLQPNTGQPHARNVVLPVFLSPGHRVRPTEAALRQPTPATWPRIDRIAAQAHAPSPRTPPARDPKALGLGRLLRSSTAEAGPPHAARPTPPASSLGFSSISLSQPLYKRKGPELTPCT